MKNLLKIIPFLFLAVNASGQFFNITNASGTTSFYGTYGVTVHGFGVYTTTSSCGSTYFIGSTAPGGYSYVLSRPVHSLKIFAEALNSSPLGLGETLQISINGSTHTIIPSEVSSFLGACLVSPPGATTYLFGGNLVGPVAVGTGSFSGGTLEICSPINIDSFSIACTISVFGITYRVQIDSIPHPGCVNIFNNGPVCFGDTLRLFAVNDTSLPYHWYGPGGFTSTLRNPIRPGVTFADSGTYFFVQTVAGVNDTFWTHVDIKPLPVITASSNSPICQGPGYTLNLFAGPLSPGETFSWSGPDVFTSTFQNPVRTGFTALDTGIYKVIATLNGCRDSTTTHVIYAPAIPPPAITGVTTYCTGQPFVPFMVVATGSLLWYTAASGGTGGITPLTVSTAVAGTTTIWVSQVVSGCESPRSPITVTVVTGPAAISGTLSVCAGAITTLFDAGGGTWSSSNTGIATVGSTGIVSGVNPGTSTITYTIGVGCSTTAIVTVNPAPPSISGIRHVCAGQTTSLTDAITGGTWSSANPSIASVGLATGLVTGGAVLFTSTVTIIYTAPGGCTASAVVTVNALPNPITSTSVVCAGSTITLSDIGGGSWSSSNTLVATVGLSTGIAGGVALTGGTATITYTLPTGCDTTTTLTVAPMPAPITGTLTMCEGGGTTTLFDINPGGFWQSSNTSVAIIDAFLGTVTGEIAGVDTITYTTSCSVSVVITVNPTPPPITGPGSVCTGSPITLADVVTGGTWSSSNTAAATVGATSGIVTGGIVVLPATSALTNITYTDPSGCTASASITIYPPPNPISGTLHVCAGQSTVLSDPPGGGTWASVNTGIATVTAGPTGGGITTGILPGTDTIIYTQAGTNCRSIAIITVNSTPGPIAGSLHLCSGACVTLSDGTLGGSWSSSNSSVASIGSGSGTVCGMLVGTSTITYSLGGTCVATAVVTVHAAPAAIGGTPVACVGTSTTLTDAAGPGTWSSSNTAVATIGPITSGAVFGASPGTSVITYTPSPATGCTRTVVVTVNSSPAIFTVTGGGSYCSGGTGVHIGISGSTPGVTYTVHSGTTSFPGVTGTGSALDLGLFTVAGTYTVTGSLACTATMTGSATITINPLPSLFTVSGGGTICPGSTGLPVLLSGSAIGISYQLFNGTAPVGPAMPGTGSALNFGTLAIAGTYTVVATSATGCTRIMAGSATVVINPAPIISGPTAVCVGATIPESAPGFTGTWSSSNTSVATVVSATGLVTGVNTGITTITFIATSGCSATTVVTVSFSPGPVTGPNTVCVGGTSTEGDIVGGGLWTCSPTSIATVGSLSAIVTGVATGTVTITYSLGSTGCTVNKIMTVTPAPAAVSGTTNLCAGTTSHLTDATTGGTWMSSNTLIATVNIAGTVSGVSPGTALITYTVGGCMADVVVTINAAPGPVTGPATLCTGSTILLGDITSGGTWTSSNSLVATVDAGDNVWGLLGGTTTITYSTGGSCVATKVLTVYPISPIAGSTGICVGATTTLIDGTGGGTWSSSNTSVATIAGGVVTGALTGTSTITYTVPGGCTATVIVTVNTAPSAIAGTMHVCAGSCTLLSDAAGGGIWSSSSIAVATVSSGGLVCGLIPGTTTITYSLGFGCTRSAVVTVNPAPPAIAGTMHMCTGSSNTLSDAVTGGTWASDNTLVATINTLTGLVWGASPGTATITYSPLQAVLQVR